VALVGLLSALAAAAEIAVADCPPVADPDDLGLRSALIVFLQEHHIAYAAGIDDEHLLQLYREYWAARRRADPASAAAAAPAPAAAEVPVKSPEAIAREEQIDRDNLVLVLRRQYGYRASPEMSLTALRAVHDGLRRQDLHAPRPVEAAASASAHGSTTAAAMLPAARTSGTPATAAAAAATPRPAAAPVVAPVIAPGALLPVSRQLTKAFDDNEPRNQGIKPYAQLVASDAAVGGQAPALRLAIARCRIYGMGTAPEDLASCLDYLIGTKEQYEVVNTAARGGDEIAELCLGLAYASTEGLLKQHDPVQADYWLQMSADHGCPQAEWEMARLARNGGRHTEADLHIRLGAEKGSLPALREVLSRPNYLTPAQKLQVKKSLLAIYAHRGTYRTELATLKRMEPFALDEAMRTQFLGARAVLGDLDAMFSIGFYSNEKTAQTAAMTRFWYQAAAERGHRNGMIMLAQVLNRTPFDPPPPLTAYTWVARSIGGGQPHGPPWDDLMQRVGLADIQKASEEARRWSPLPANTPLVIPPECAIDPLPAMEEWPIVLYELPALTPAGQ
jgi:TPR repeat protein